MQGLQHLSVRNSLPLALAITSLLPLPAAAQSTLRVGAGGYATIQAAVDAAAPTGDTILIDAGLYTGPGNRDVQLGSKELTLRGRAGAGECRIDCEGTSQYPFRAILIEGGQTSATVIENLSFTGGATLDGAISDPFDGGAIRMLGTSPIIRNCLFEENSAGCWGGAVFSAHGGAPLIENCVFRNNYSADGGGGFFSWDGSAPTIRNCVFIGNDGNTIAGAVEHLSSGLLVIEGCTFVQNQAQWASAVYTWGGRISNSIVWNNSGQDPIYGGQNTTILDHCNVEFGLPFSEWDMGGNISAAPRFRSDGFHLGLMSPCIDAGDPGTVTQGLRDIDGGRRIVNQRIDIGADEFKIHAARPR